MERCLTDLEEHPDDAALIADIFRSVHTIKGTTGFLGFKRLETLAHTGENLLGLVREGRLAATPPIITGLLELLDVLRSVLKNIEADGREGEDHNDASLIANLEHLQAPAKASKVRQPAAPHSDPAPVASQPPPTEKGGANVASDPPLASVPPTRTPSAPRAPGPAPEASEAEPGRAPKLPPRPP